MRDVVARSAQIAARYGKDSFSLPLNRVWEIENSGVVPSIYRLYSFSIIYRRSFEELLSVYGVDLEESVADCGLVGAPRTHLTTCIAEVDSEALDLSGDIDLRQTARLGNRVEERIGRLFPYRDTRRYSYGYVGTEDVTMSPLLPPGALVQIDESSTRVTKGPWRSEYERPIYFVETRQGFRCCWCMIKDGQIILQPHSLSSATVSVHRHPQEAEVVGRVVAAVVQFPAAGAPDQSAMSTRQTTCTEKRTNSDC